MIKIKRFLCLLLSLIFIFNIFSFSVFAADSDDPFAGGSIDRPDFSGTDSLTESSNIGSLKLAHPDWFNGDYFIFSYELYEGYFVVITDINSNAVNYVHSKMSGWRYNFRLLDSEGKDCDYMYYIVKPDFSISYHSRIYSNTTVGTNILGRRFNGHSDFDPDAVNGDSDEPGFWDLWDYQRFPDIEDYIEDFPPFPGFDPEHPLDSIWLIIKWIGSCLVVIGHNLWGLFRWLGACLWTIIQNIVIAMHNSLVYIKNLLKLLFVPGSNFFRTYINEFKETLNEKIPHQQLVDCIQSIENGLNNGSEPPNITINIFGHEVNGIDFSAFDSWRSYVHSIITAISYVFCIKYVFKKLPTIINNMPS